MNIKDKEHAELMAMFEKIHNGSFRLDREPKEIWGKDALYKNGETNDCFMAFRDGYVYGKGESK